MNFLLFMCLLNPWFWVAHGVNVAATVADVETTQACIRAGTCHEGNPMMGQSRAQQYGVSMGLNAINAWISYRSSKHGGKWWILPAISAGSHVVAGGLNLRF